MDKNNVNEICHSIYEYITEELKNCIDNDLFLKNSFEELGKYYFDITLMNVKNATTDLIRAVIDTFATKDSVLECMDDYYKACCKIMHIIKIPSKLLLDVKKEYNEIFVQNYNRVVQKIDAEITCINTKLNQIRVDSDLIKDTPSSYSFMRDISSDEIKLYEYTAECNHLKTRKEMIEFVRSYITSKLMEYCNINDINSIEQALKREAVNLAKNDAYDAEYGFSSYRDIVSTAEDEIDRPYTNFYKIKIYTAIESARKNYYFSSYKLSEEDLINQYKSDISKIPKIDDLHFQKNNDQEAYLSTLKKYVSDYNILEELIKMINESVCLRDRKDILPKCIELFKTGEFELFSNIAPIQIEGMFADFLRDSTTFRRFTKLTIYPTAVLREKIQYLHDINIEMYPEAVEYFMFYFNNMVRNKVAHGNYRSVFKNDIQAEIFSFELILDMSLLVYMLSRTSETEKMYRFIHRYKEYYSNLINSEHPLFGALFNDITKNKTISTYDSISRYSPIQVVYWIVNPYYERIYEAIENKNELLELRSVFLSKEFWTYVLDNLNEVIKSGYDYKNINWEFGSVIKGIFRCNITDEVKTLLGKVNAAYNLIKTLKN